MSAAIMDVQIERAPEILARRHRNGNLYRKLFADQDHLQIQKILPGHQASDYIMAPVIQNESITPHDVIAFLKANQIGSRTIYSILSYEQPAYQDLASWPLSRVIDYPDYSQVSCPNAEKIARHHFELPMVSSLTDENIQYIVDNVLNFFETKK